METPLRVLMVEDSEDDAVLVSRELKRSGFGIDFERVDTPEDMWSALNHKNWDIVVADYSMPRFNGLAALALLQQSGLDLPFVIVSGTIGEEVAVAAMKAGAHDYVMKDKLARLGPAVRRELHEAEVRNARREAENRNVELYQETLQQSSKLAALLEIGQDISAILDLEKVLARIASHAKELLDSDDSDVYLLQPDGKTLRAIVSLGDYAEQMESTPLQVGEGIVGHVAMMGVPEIVDQTEFDERAVYIPGTPHESHCLMCAPLVARGEIIGVMALARNGREDGFVDDDLDFLVGLARQAAIAIENARHYATEQKRNEELARALEQQRELDRLKDQFIQNVSHELRTPVAIILGYSDLLSKGELGELQPDQQQPMDTIARRASMLHKLVDDLTAILQAEAQEVRLYPVDMSELAANVVDDYVLAAEKAGLTMVAEVDADLPAVFGDLDHLRRALDNLIGNAIKFTEPGGRISVSLKQIGETLVLDVIDNGVGIPMEELDRIFDRFYQVDGTMTRRYGGTGLGLALVKEIVRVHGGSILVESEPDKGSIFHVTLPIESE